MKKFLGGMKAGEQGEALLVIRPMGADMSDCTDVQTVKAKTNSEAAKLYLERVTGGKVAFLPPKN